MKPWPVAHSIELKRLLAVGETYEAVVVILNTEFGATYTRKACIGRANRMRYVSAFPQTRAWPVAHCEKLQELVSSGLTYRYAAERLNGLFNTEYSRNACIGQLRRMGVSPPRRTPVGCKGRQPAASKTKREKRWAANPALAQRALRSKEMAETRAKMQATKTSRTAACYRKHMPRLPEMTKSELRAMLTAAIQNTAAMGVT